MCVFYRIAPITISMVYINMEAHGKLGSLGFALARGLVRGLNATLTHPTPLDLSPTVQPLSAFMSSDQDVGSPKETNNRVLGQLQWNDRRVFDIPLIKGRPYLSGDWSLCGALFLEKQRGDYKVRFRPTCAIIGRVSQLTWIAKTSSPSQLPEVIRVLCCPGNSP